MGTFWKFFDEKEKKCAKLLECCFYRHEREKS